MDRIGAQELNQNTSIVLARVSRGETIEVIDRGRPVARLVPAADHASTLARLVAAGRAHAPTTTGPVPAPEADGRAGVAAELTAQRNGERW